jgi:hypothetical protein
MRLGKSEEIKRKYKAAFGNTPCDHPELEKETSMMGTTGDYICLRCGKDAPYDVLMEERRKLKGGAS